MTKEMYQFVQNKFNGVGKLSCRP